MSRRKRLTYWGADEDDDSLARAVIAGLKTVTLTLSRTITSPMENTVTAVTRLGT